MIATHVGHITHDRKTCLSQPLAIAQSHRYSYQTIDSSVNSLTNVDTCSLEFIVFHFPRGNRSLPSHITLYFTIKPTNHGQIVASRVCIAIASGAIMSDRQQKTLFFFKSIQTYPQKTITMVRKYK